MIPSGRIPNNRTQIQNAWLLSASASLLLIAQCWAAEEVNDGDAQRNPPVKIELTELELACQKGVLAKAPDAASDLLGPDVHKDWNEDITVGWSSVSGEFYRHPTGETNAAKSIGEVCSKVVVVAYSGPTGGTERWYIRRDGFSVRHSRDSGLPGDEDKYSGWDSVPFNYDPGKNYK